MPQFLITSPDGKKFKVNAPEGATKDDALKRVQRHQLIQAIPSDYLEIAQKNIGNPDIENKFTQQFGVSPNEAINERLKKTNKNIAPQAESKPQINNEKIANADFFSTENLKNFGDSIVRGNKQAALGAIQALGIHPELSKEFEQQATELKKQGDKTGFTGVVGEMIGDPKNAALTLIPPLAVGGKAATVAANLVSRGAQGAAYGALTPKEEGQTTKENAVSNAAIFAIAPPVLDKIFKGVGLAGSYVGGKVIDFFKSSPEKAKKLILETAKYEGVEPSVIYNKFQEAIKLKPDASLLDVMQKRVGGVNEQGDYFRALGKSASEKLTDSELNATAAKNIPYKKSAQKLRVENYLDNAFGVKGAFQAEKDIAGAKKQIAETLRQQAVNYPKNIRADDIEALIRLTPDGDKLIESLKPISEQGVALGTRTPTTTDFLDGLKKALDDKVLSLKKVTDPETAGTAKGVSANYKELSKLIKQRIVDNNPYYADYLSKYGDEFDNQQALELGQNFLKENVDSLKDEFSKFSQAEKQNFVTGAKQALFDNLDKKTNVVEPLLNDATKKRLELLFPTKKQAETFFKKIELEKSFTNTAQDFLKRDKSIALPKGGDVKNALRGISNSLNFNLNNSVQNATMNVLMKRIENKFNNLDKKTAESLVNILYSSDPKKFEFLKKVANDKNINYNELMKEVGKISKRSLPTLTTIGINKE